MACSLAFLAMLAFTQARVVGVLRVVHLEHQGFPLPRICANRPSWARRLNSSSPTQRLEGGHRAPPGRRPQSPPGRGEGGTEIAAGARAVATRSSRGRDSTSRPSGNKPGRWFATLVARGVQGERIEQANRRCSAAYRRRVAAMVLASTQIRVEKLRRFGRTPRPLFEEGKRVRLHAGGALDNQHGASPHRDPCARRWHIHRIPSSNSRRPVKRGLSRKLWAAQLSITLIFRRQIADDLEARDHSAALAEACQRIFAEQRARAGRARVECRARTRRGAGGVVCQTSGRSSMQLAG